MNVKKAAVKWFFSDKLGEFRNYKKKTLGSINEKLRKQVIFLRKILCAEFTDTVKCVNNLFRINVISGNIYWYKKNGGGGADKEFWHFETNCVVY